MATVHGIPAGGMVAGTFIPAGSPAPFDTRTLDDLEVTTRLTFEA